MAPARKKVIIDTDPGIDDAMAILMAFQSPDVEIIGMTTIFGNVSTPLATTNALYLCELGGLHIPVAEGSWEPLKGGVPRIADFVHGADGFGNTNVVPMLKKASQKSEQAACDFLIQKVAENPGEITIVALGPLTNVALAIQKDPSFGSNIDELIVLGGAFFASGNVTPAAEANIFGDPEAADIVFTAGINTQVIGINLTTQVILNEEDLLEIKNSKSKYGSYLYDITRFYRAWHLSSDGLDGIFLHDPTCMAALLNSSLFTYRTGVVRVETQGLCTGLTLLDMGLKEWIGDNPWVRKPAIKVGWTVNTTEVRKLVKDLLMRP
ncbi:hypothetical protein Mapa_013907 [Marchantia paleacea]|nr:hypothetical protein Mapa_013907 [Marchantia paleacea]